MSITSTVPSAASVGAFSPEIATAQAAAGDYDPAVANALRTFATTAVADLTAIDGRNGSLIQSGVATLTAGDSGAIAATVTANTRIIVTLKTANTTTLTTNYAALSGDRSVGAPGSFKIKAVVAAGTINVADGSTVDWIAIG
jgi:hypothetical protein